jgi:hypothetical protein
VQNFASPEAKFCKLSLSLYGSAKINERTIADDAPAHVFSVLRAAFTAFSYGR